MTAPLPALLMADCTCALVDPAGHDHVVPLPVHCARAGTDPSIHISISPARQAIRRIIMVQPTINIRLRVLTGGLVGAVQSAAS